MSIYKLQNNENLPYRSTKFSLLNLQTKNYEEFAKYYKNELEKWFNKILISFQAENYEK